MNPKTIENMTKGVAIIIVATTVKYGPKVVKKILEKLGRK